VQQEERVIAIKEGMKKKNESNTTTGTDDVAKVHKETNTSMNGTSISVGCW
jgi:hypothetical protein